VGLIAETYDAMRAVGRSPDRSVTITVSGRGDVDIELADDAKTAHTEERLARQVAAAARVALAAYRSQQKAAIDKAVRQAWSAR
jgi:DNA-binding protein YbaB